jgi:hypothetical protein
VSYHIQCLFSKVTIGYNPSATAANPARVEDRRRRLGRERLRIEAVCPGREPPFLTVKRPHKSAIQNRLTVENAKLRPFQRPGRARTLEPQRDEVRQGLLPHLSVVGHQQRSAHVDVPSRHACVRRLDLLRTKFSKYAMHLQEGHQQSFSPAVPEHENAKRTKFSVSTIVLMDLRGLAMRHVNISLAARKTT